MNSCTICRHPERQRIEAALVQHKPFRRIGQEFNVGYTSVMRHQKHVITSLAKARESIEMADASSLLMRVDEVLRDARRITQKAEKDGDLQVALQGLRTITQSLALLGRITGEIQQQTPSVSFHAHLHTTAAPRSPEQLDREIALHVREATDDFDPGRIEYLRQLAGKLVLESECVTETSLDARH